MQTSHIMPRFDSYDTRIHILSEYADMNRHKYSTSVCRCALLTAITVLLLPAPTQAAEDAGHETLEKSVVLIRSVRQDFDHTTPWKQTAMSQGTGSGFIIAGNRILTNAHNVSNCKYVEIKKQNLAKRYRSKAAFIGHDCDLAIITVLDETFFSDTVALEMGDIPKVNTTVQTYGFPVGGQHVSVTEGVVSRVQMDVYSHTQADSHLVVQTDAAINPGNSGGPVLQNGKVVGVAFQGLRQADNIGYMIPTTVIRHFLEDIEDGRYDGFGSLGLTLYPALHNESYPDYLKLPSGTEGIVVIRTTMHSSVESLLQSGDVITRIDDFNIDNDGMIQIYGLTLHMSEVVEQKQLGQEVKLTFYRYGELKEETAVVALNRPVLAYWRQYDLPPRYVVFAGLTFVPVSRNFLETWGPNWAADIPHDLRYLFNNSDQLNTDRERKEYVVLSEILPDEITSYCSQFENKVVQTVNGVDIWSLDDLPTAFAKSDDGFCTLQFMGSGTPLILDYKDAVSHHTAVLEKYQVPAEANLEGKL